MGNCFSSHRGTTGKLSGDPTHGTGLTSLHSMGGGGPMGPGVMNQDQNPNNVLGGLQGHGGPITSDVGVRNVGPGGVGVLNPHEHPGNGNGLAHGLTSHHQLGLDHRPLPDPGGDNNIIPNFLGSKYLLFEHTRCLGLKKSKRFDQTLTYLHTTQKKPLYSVN